MFGVWLSLTDIGIGLACRLAIIGTTGLGSLEIEWYLGTGFFTYQRGPKG
jgi:uncharacterized membrane protein YccF (DUF307 family)